MKTLNLFFTTIIYFLTSNAYSQDTLKSSMMPLAGDTLFYRSINNPNYDTAFTGENFIWDFSNINANNWSADTFVTVSSTPLAYNAQFNNPLFPKYKATLASPQGDVNIPLGGFNFSNIYYYYKLTSDSLFSQVGQALTVNSIPIPIKFTDVDNMYLFPSVIGNYDTCYSSYSVTIPQVGFNSRQQTRYNWIDGYGTVITPIDTFYNAVRVKTIIKSRDSIYSDQYNMPFAFNTTTTEYKWFAEGHRGPVVIISKSQGTGNNRNTLKYRDTPEPTTEKIENHQKETLGIKIFPNPFNDYISIVVDNTNLPCYLVLKDIQGKTIFAQHCNTNSDILKVSYNLRNIISGVYFLTFSSNNSIQIKKIIKE